MTTSKCRVSGETLEPVFDLGNLCVSDFPDTAEAARSAPRSPLHLGVGPESGLIQLLDTVDPDSMYRNYWYFSGTNQTMTRQLREVVETVGEWTTLRDDDLVLDVGCNDGTLLKQYDAVFHGTLAKPPLKLVKVGIDPAQNVGEVGSKACHLHAADYFTRDTFFRLTGGVQAKVITSIAMFYDLPDPNAFVADVAACLAPRGVWILQLSYTPLMLAQNAFDNICHEHLEYYDLATLTALVGQHGLRIMSADLNDVNAGSFRVVVGHASDDDSEVSGMRRALGAFSRDALLIHEEQTACGGLKALQNFKWRVDAQRESTRALLASLKRQGKKVYGYGASTKGNTLLQYYGLDADLLPAIAERQARKVGKFTVGSAIPIVGEEEMRAARPDYLLVLPWHFLREFREREREFVARGGKFIVPLPELRVI